MAIERIVVQNFQSLKKLDLALGRFTVIVGPSSSGKSAFLRAVKGLASNIKGSSVITSGEKSAAISLYTETNIISLKKTATSGKYIITDRLSGSEENFTKLAQKVPEAVTRALNIQPVSTSESSINFAGQFDKPYLLGDTASHVAKILGDLTNVSVIFEASREANKKKLATNALLKTRQSDLEALVAQAQQFRGLAARRKAIEAAESALEEILQLRGTQRQLEQIIASMEASEATLATLLVSAQVPSVDEVNELHLKYSQFRKLLISWAGAVKKSRTLDSELAVASAQEKEAHDLLHSKLQELGKCPTCDQTILRS